MARVALERGAFLRIVDAEGAPAVGLDLRVALAHSDGRIPFDAPSTPEPPDEEGLVDLAGWIEGNEPAPWVVLFAEQPALRLEPGVLAIASLGATATEAPVVRCTFRPAAPSSIGKGLPCPSIRCG